MLLNFDEHIPTALDYGSGSGILGIATMLRQPTWNVDFVDIDMDAHHNCAQNLDLNKLNTNQAKLILVTDRDGLKQTYSLVFANILENILHDESQFLIEKTCIDGYLILSGLLKHQIERTKELYLACDKLELVKKEIMNDWGCLVFRKKR